MPASPPIGTPRVPCEYPLGAPLLTLARTSPLLPDTPSGPSSQRPHAPAHRRMGYSLGTHRVLAASMRRSRCGCRRGECPHAPSGQTESNPRMYVETGPSGNGPKWERVQVGTKARTRLRVVGPKVSVQPRPHTHALTHRVAHTLWLSVPVIGR